MDNGSVLEDESGSDMNARLVSIYLLAQIRKHKPEWFEEVEAPHPHIKKKRKKKPNPGSKSNFIITKNNDSSWEDNLVDFVAFEKTMRVYQ